MKTDTSQLIDAAINNLWLRRRYVADEITIDLALLVREADQKQLSAIWWRGKPASIIGVDVNGNFVLSCAGGEVKLWHHIQGKTLFLSKSHREFIQGLENDPNAIT